MIQPRGEHAAVGRHLEPLGPQLGGVDRELGGVMHQRGDLATEHLVGRVPGDALATVVEERALPP